MLAKLSGSALNDDRAAVGVEGRCRGEFVVLGDACDCVIGGNIERWQIAGVVGVTDAFEVEVSAGRKIRHDFAAGVGGFRVADTHGVHMEPVESGESPVSLPATMVLLWNMWNLTVSSASPVTWWTMAWASLLPARSVVTAEAAAPGATAAKWQARR
nr:hypothetical protein [Kibdelosporangium aridum]